MDTLIARIVIDFLLIAVTVIGIRFYYKSEIQMMREDSFKAIRKERKEKAEAYNKGFIDGIMIQKVNRHTSATESNTEVIPKVN